MASKKKNIVYVLITFDFDCGEYGIGCDFLIEVEVREGKDKNKKLERAVDKFFRDFYPTENNVEVMDGGRYLYHQGEVACELKRWREVPEDDAMVLRKYGI